MWLCSLAEPESIDRNPLSIETVSLIFSAIAIASVSSKCSVDTRVVPNIAVPRKASRTASEMSSYSRGAKLNLSKTRSAISWADPPVRRFLVAGSSLSKDQLSASTTLWNRLPPNPALRLIALEVSIHDAMNSFRYSSSFFMTSAVWFKARQSSHWSVSDPHRLSRLSLSDPPCAKSVNVYSVTTGNSRMTARGPRESHLRISGSWCGYWINDWIYMSSNLW